MPVIVSEKIHSLYEQSGDDFVATLRWIIGYLNTSYTRRLQASVLNTDWHKGVTVHFPEELLHLVRSRVSASMELDEAVNLFLLMAYVLGGSQ